MPETSRSFHYWQPAPRFRLLPRLANPGNPVMSPHIGKGNRHLSHWIDSRKREGISGEKLPGWRATTPRNATSTCSKYTQERLQCRAHGNSRTCAYAKTADYQKTPTLFVVNSVKLHLPVTAFMTANLIYSCYMKILIMTKSLRVVICPWILDQVQQIVWLYIRRDCILLGRSAKFCFIIPTFLFLVPFCDIEAR